MYGTFPLKRLLKGQLLEIAELQDKLLIELLSAFDVVLHGGTAIWRIYGGKRFSFDIDIYHSNPEAVLRHFRQAPFRMEKGKVTSPGVVYMRFVEGKVSVEVDISPPFQKLDTADGEYRLVGGDAVVIQTLSPPALLREKIATFRDRKKAKDLYDIFYLLDSAGPAAREVASLKPLKQPADFAGLQEIILLGKAPDFQTIARKVNAYAKVQ